MSFKVFMKRRSLVSFLSLISFGVLCAFVGFHLGYASGGADVFREQFDEGSKAFFGEGYSIIYEKIQQHDLDQANRYIADFSTPIVDQLAMHLKRKRNLEASTELRRYERLAKKLLVIISKHGSPAARPLPDTLKYFETIDVDKPE